MLRNNIDSTYTYIHIGITIDNRVETAPKTPVFEGNVWLFTGKRVLIPVARGVSRQ